MKLLKNQLLSTLILTLAVAFPVQSLAESDQLWTKVRGMVVYDKTIAFGLTEQELSELKFLATSGDANAQFAMGIVCLAKHEFTDAEFFLEQAAAQGHVHAQYRYQQYQQNKLRVSDLGR